MKPNYKKDDFLGTLCASLLGNLLSAKKEIQSVDVIIIAGSGITKTKDF